MNLLGMTFSDKGNGNSVLSFKLNGKETDNFIPCDIADMNEIEILLS